LRDGWQEVALGDLAEIAIGRTPPRNDPSYWTTALDRPFCSIADIGAQRLIDPAREGVTEEAVLDGKAKRVPAGSLLMSFKLSIGRTGIAAKDLYSNEAIAWIEPRDEDEVSREFLRLYLPRIDFDRYIGVAVKGKTLNSASLRALPIALPPIEEQRRIADLLNAFDSVVARCRVHHGEIGRLAEPLRARMLSSGGRGCKLRDLAVPDGIQIGPFGSQLHASDYRDTGSPVVMPKDMIGGRINTASIARVGSDDATRLTRHRLQVGDILLARRGDLTKRALVEEGQEGWLCGTGSIRIRVPIDQSRLVFETLSRNEASRWLVSHAVGTTMLNLNTHIVGDLPLVIPDLAVAQPYLAALETIESLERDADIRLIALHDARDASLSALLSGAHAIPDSYDRFITDAVEPELDAVVV